MTKEEILNWIEESGDFEALLDVYNDICGKLSDRAEEAYRRLAELDPKKVDDYLVQYGGFEFDGQDVVVEADEYWRYGGYEHHLDYFPIWWLWDDSWEQGVLNRKAEREREEREKKEAVRKAKEKSERETYERLKTKFEDEQ